MTTAKTNAALSQGWKLHQDKRYAAAEEIYRAVIASCPKDANAWCYLGILLHDRRQYSAAVDAYRTALHLNPKFPIALNNLGNSLRYLHEFEAADRSFQQAIDLQPNYVNAYKNRGTLHVWTGHLEAGRTYYEQALAIAPDEADLHRNLGIIYLLQGDFGQGWEEYSWRWRVGDLNRPALNVPVWNGENLEGKAILLTAEQGLGDTLHFVRLAKSLRSRTVRTTVYCQPQLMALLQNSPELGPVYPNSLQPDRSFQFQCSLLDVAGILKLDADSIPGEVPYIRPSSHLIAFWNERLKRQPGAFRIGIAWQGNPEHQADAFRSIPLAEFEPLAELPGVEMISLQSGYGTEQLSDWQGVRPIGQPGELDQSSGAFMDTAAIMQSLDLVVTSDTAIAHLAGAMAIPTWIALGYIPDWRWLLERDDSPWYPSVRLFRQPRIGDWRGVFEVMAETLRSLIEQKRTQF